MKTIEVEPEQLAELMKLCAEYSTMSDMLTGDDIYRECMKQRAGSDYRWAHYCAVATVLRTGYILGQQAERERRSRTHTHTHTRRGLSFSAAQNGGRQHE